MDWGEGIGGMGAEGIDCRSQAAHLGKLDVRRWVFWAPFPRRRSRTDTATVPRLPHGMFRRTVAVAAEASNTRRQS